MSHSHSVGHGVRDTQQTTQHSDATSWRRSLSYHDLMLDLSASDNYRLPSLADDSLALEQDRGVWLGIGNLDNSSRGSERPNAQNSTIASLSTVYIISLKYCISNRMALLSVLQYCQLGKYVSKTLDHHVLGVLMCSVTHQLSWQTSMTLSVNLIKWLLNWLYVGCCDLGLRLQLSKPVLGVLYNIWRAAELIRRRCGSRPVNVTRTTTVNLTATQCGVDVDH